MFDPDLEHRVAVAGGHIEPAWDDTRARAVLGGLERRRARRALLRGALALAVLAAGAGAWLALSGPREPRALRFADGSFARPLDARSVVRADGLHTAWLDAGRARFEVVPNPSRRFRVEAGEVSVEVLGTQFTVERLPHGARVAVERGRVRVAWRGAEVELGVGESGVFPDPILSFLAAADQARVRGRPAEALAPLERVIAEHPDDARAPLAAFTLGRLLLDELNRPREAADAFARARSLEPNGPLARDAAAREAEARARAGAR